MKLMNDACNLRDAISTSEPCIAFRAALPYPALLLEPCPPNPAPSRQLSTEEQQKVVGMFNNPAEAREHGIRLAGTKYFTLSANERSVYGKKGVSATRLFFHDRRLRRARRTRWPTAPCLAFSSQTTARHHALRVR